MIDFGEVIYCCVTGCPYKAVGWLECQVEKRFLQGYEFTGRVRAFCPWHGVIGLFGGVQEGTIMHRFLGRE